MAAIVRPVRFDGQPSKKQKGEQIIASERDCEIFFDAITNPASPNEALLRAADRYISVFTPNNERT